MIFKLSGIKDQTKFSLSFSVNTSSLSRDWKKVDKAHVYGFLNVTRS